MNKVYILLLFIVSFQVVNAQKRIPFWDTKVVLKSGDTLTGTGKVKDDAFKFKAVTEKKSVYLDYADIHVILQRAGVDKPLETYRALQTTEYDDYIQVKVVLLGDKLELYTTEFGYKDSWETYSLLREKNLNYYLKRSSEDRLTDISNHSLLGMYNFKEMLTNYMADCPQLVSLIEENQFDLKKEVPFVVSSYNKYCE